MVQVDDVQHLVGNPDREDSWDTVEVEVAKLGEDLGRVGDWGHVAD